MENIQHSTFNVERPVNSILALLGRWALNVECWTFPKFRRRARNAVWLLILVSIAVSAPAEETNRLSKPERFITYTNDVNPDKPLSIHIVKIDRARSDLRFYTTLGGGDTMGMGVVSEQVKTVPREIGQPLAAVNGDFYEEATDYPTRPRDIQIRNGEVLTHPDGHTSFWLDAKGRPQMTNIVSRFRAVWPSGKAIPFGLNLARSNGCAVLFTSAIGKTTLTHDGREYILEKSGDGDWLPLRVGKTYKARVRAVRSDGNSPVDRETMVLSLDPNLAAKVRDLHPGATIRIVTETHPDLSGADFAIGGGPALVRNSKVLTWKGWLHFPHPRTALGWNQTHFFLVQADGRQLDLSIGMTFPDLADYMLKIGCEEAMNLDGGGSATLWAFGAVRNSPSEGEERPAPNALVVVKKNLERETK